MNRSFMFLAVVFAAAVAENASARPPRGAARYAPAQRISTPNTISQASFSAPNNTIANANVHNGIVTTSGSMGAQEALDEVNATRAARGLPPYIRDPGLTQAAMTIASQRASRQIQGHTANDFAGVPSGTSASASGCAAWPASMGWGSCCTYDRYTYAGAAWAAGNDGRRYMQLFVR